jgi:hypothetical protein
MDVRVWIWLLSLSVLWGGSFFFAKVAIGELGPLTVVFAHVALAALALDMILGRDGNQPVPTKRAVASLFRDGIPEQCSAVQPDLLGPDPHRRGTGVDPECHDATVYLARHPCADQ